MSSSFVACQCVEGTRSSHSQSLRACGDRCTQTGRGGTGGERGRVVALCVTMTSLSAAVYLSEAQPAGVAGVDMIRDAWHGGGSELVTVGVWAGGRSVRRQSDAAVREVRRPPQLRRHRRLGAGLERVITASESLSLSMIPEQSLSAPDAPRPAVAVSSVRCHASSKRVHCERSLLPTLSVSTISLRWSDGRTFQRFLPILPHVYTNLVTCTNPATHRGLASSERFAACPPLKSDCIAPAGSIVSLHPVALAPGLRPSRVGYSSPTLS